MTPHWVIVFVAFMDGTPVNSKFFGPIATEAECNKNRAELVEMVQGQGADLWAECREVKLEPRKDKAKDKDGKPLFLKPERNS
jgi:hypothetical protein